MDFFLDFISQTVVNRYSLLYRIEGIEDTANPYMLCGHYDVVPPGTDWDSDPYPNQLVEEDGQTFVYGRGAIDCKLAVFAILEALESMAKAGWVCFVNCPFS